MAVEILKDSPVTTAGISMTSSIATEVSKTPRGPSGS